MLQQQRQQQQQQQLWARSRCHKPSARINRHAPTRFTCEARDVQEVRAVRRLGVVCGAWNLCRWLELRFSPWDTTNMSEHETKEPVEAVSNVMCDET